MSIVVKNVVKSFGQQKALKDVSFSIPSGEIVGFLGPNGAGKSTTINLLLNFIAPTSGEAFINGDSVIEKSKETKSHLTYIPENLMLYPTLTAVENLDYFLGIGGKK